MREKEASVHGRELVSLSRSSMRQPQSPTADLRAATRKGGKVPQDMEGDRRSVGHTNVPTE